MGHLRHFNNHNCGTKHDDQTNDPIFLIHSLSSIRWYNSFLNLKTFKIQFLGVPLLHYLLVCKIHTYMPKITLSSLLTQISFFYRKFANFWCITFFVCNLIQIWPRSRELLHVFTFPFQTPIISSLPNIVTSNFTMYILTIFICSLKINVIVKKETHEIRDTEDQNKRSYL